MVQLECLTLQSRQNEVAESYETIQNLRFFKAAKSWILYLIYEISWLNQLSSLEL